jgi:hypothetical protein
MFEQRAEKVERDTVKNQPGMTKTGKKILIFVKR